MGASIPFRRRRGPVPFPAPLRLMVWSGLLSGLLAFQAMRLWQAPRLAAAIEATRQAEDLYAEARRSRAILEAQDGAPPSALDAGAGAREAAPPAAVIAAVRVIDGDTFDMGATRIRIADIDTPELNGRCAEESARAARATARLGALLAAGPFELHPAGDGRDADGYGRRLRIVTRHGRSLGEQLVAEGLARRWTGRREPWCA
ncbi:MAG TPA: thermonuclease family protein [Allosphingosinicella sp.]|nr:thermonuclease family protein [Allosphingosinicella sp.]